VVAVKKLKNSGGEFKWKLEVRVVIVLQEKCSSNMDGNSDPF